MAMTPAGLSAAIITELGGVVDSAEQKKFADALAKAIVLYLQANAVAPAGGGNIQ